MITPEPMLCSQPAMTVPRPDRSCAPYRVTRIWTTLGDTLWTIVSTASLKASRELTAALDGGDCGDCGACARATTIVAEKSPARIAENNARRILDVTTYNLQRTGLDGCGVS